MIADVGIAAEDLERALHNEEIRVFYQPQVDISGRIASVESLVRWEHPERGWISPVSFIPLAERSGLIHALGAVVLEKACADGLKWPDITIGVNVSPIQFRFDRFAENLIETVRRTGFPAERLELEITEGSYFEDVARAEQDMLALRRERIRFALDDFGVGYASLTYLRRLPFDKLKIDKSFVDDIETIGSAAIVQALCAMSRALGMKTTAEGVETVEQQKRLRLCGCTYLQGYLISRPVPASELEKLLASKPSMPKVG